MEKELLTKNKDKDLKQEGWVHYKEVVEKLGFSKSRLYRLAKEGKLEIKKGFVSFQSLIELEKERERKKGRPAVLLTKDQVQELVQKQIQDLQETFQKEILQIKDELQTLKKLNLFHSFSVSLGFLSKEGS